MASSAPQTERAVLDALQRLIAVVAELRSPERGCPWDLAQTQQSLIPYAIEEAYEVADAIRSQDRDAIVEELGDLLLQVVLHAQIASESDHFDLGEVASGIADKLVRRHPHVFGDDSAESAEQVHRNWERIKAQEKGQSPEAAPPLSHTLDRDARTLPPLLGGTKISQKAAAAGFEWPDADGVWAKFDEELAEFKQALQHQDAEAQQAELGDLLFTLLNLARWYGLDPSEALHGTSRRLVQRLAHMEAQAQHPLTEYGLEELQRFWQQAKAQSD
ncbi:MAG: nucleoside triphosphate pyrophosphohydrolase [Cyanobacteria bacterium QS_8_64_29]|nr:MAG: nucleoside triphosphate pyrophosphohydrolase [Cyanobacteria bacterium QS_8_64_29]